MVNQANERQTGRALMESKCPLGLMTRREMLRRAGAGFGRLGLAGALDPAGLLGTVAESTQGAPVRTHFPARAKRVIFLFMNGGPSHVDTFDPKPALKKHENELPSGKFERKAKLG